MKRHWMLATGFISLFGTHSLSGDIVTVIFEGTVGSVSDAAGDFPGVLVGDPVTGTYSYDTDTVDELPENTELGRYSSPIPPAMFSINVGPLSFQAATSVIVGVGNDAGGPLDTLGIHGIVAETDPTMGLNLLFVDTTGTAHSDISLPQDPPNLAQFAIASGNVRVPANSSLVSFEFTSIGFPTAPIPTVSAWGLAVVSLMLLTAGIVVLRRRVVG